MDFEELLKKVENDPRFGNHLDMDVTEVSEHNNGTLSMEKILEFGRHVLKEEGYENIEIQSTPGAPSICMADKNNGGCIYIYEGSDGRRTDTCKELVLHEIAHIGENEPEGADHGPEFFKTYIQLLAKYMVGQTISFHSTS